MVRVEERVGEEGQDSLEERRSALEVLVGGCLGVWEAWEAWEAEDSLLQIL